MCSRAQSTKRIKLAACRGYLTTANAGGRRIAQQEPAFLKSRGLLGSPKTDLGAQHHLTHRCAALGQGRRHAARVDNAKVLPAYS